MRARIDAQRFDPLYDSPTIGSVVDPAATLKRAEALGGRIAMPPVEVPGGITFARFADPEGNIIGIVRRPN